MGFERLLDEEALNSKTYGKVQIVKQQLTTGLKYSEIDKTKTVDVYGFLFTWLKINKSYPLGIVIGELLQKEDIPGIYKRVILSSKKIIKHV